MDRNLVTSLNPRKKSHFRDEGIKKAEILPESCQFHGLPKFSHMGKTNSTLLNLLQFGAFYHRELHVILSNMQILLISVHCSGTEVLVKGSLSMINFCPSIIIQYLFLRQLWCGDLLFLKYFIYTCKFKLCILFTYIIFATSSDVLTLFAILFLYCVLISSVSAFLYLFYS